MDSNCLSMKLIDNPRDIVLFIDRRSRHGMGYFDIDEILAGETIIKHIVNTRENVYMEFPLWTTEIVIEECEIHLENRDIIEKETKARLEAGGRNRYFYKCVEKLLSFCYSDEVVTIIRKSIVEREL
eukprot:GHVR01052428.1.p2 GENE.GHVR01052428.1~~GHVR01052428.1.p2  ORF type:complete len:127 (+),score=12.93 GHVR01052428.1:730-1110(+)